MFDISQPICENGERHEERYGTFLDALLAAFADSPEGKACAAGTDCPGQWANLFLQYYFDHIGDTLSDVTVHDVREVVYELIPRKVSIEPEVAPELIAELRSFWGFLGRECRLPQAGAIMLLFTDQSVLTLKNALADPRNFGPAKSFIMQGQAAGFDMTTQEGLDQFMAAYNASILVKRGLAQANNDIGSGIVPYRIDEFLDGDRPQRSSANTKEKRKARKAQRQARKRNRR